MSQRHMMGKRVLVTGAGTGIGRGIGLEFARSGADVVFHYYNEKDGAESAVAEVHAAGGRAWAISVDFNRLDDVRALPDAAAKLLGGGLDVLVNNAGITMNQAFLETTPAEYDTLFNVNLRAMFFASQAAARLMSAAGRGNIVNISSVHAFGSMTEHTVYAATKAAVVGLTRAMALELIQKNIRVNCIASGWVLVENQRRTMGWGPDFDVAAAGRGLPCGFVGEPRDIGQLAIFLASDDSRYIVGQTIACDGGQTTVLPCTPNFRDPTTVRWGQGYVPGR